MNILKIKLFATFILLFSSIFLLAQDEIYFESEIKQSPTGDYGLYVKNNILESFMGVEFHQHDNHTHYRIAMRPSTDGAAKGAFIAQTGQLAVGTNDPCARVYENPNVMLSIEGDAAKTGDAYWYGTSDKRLKTNIESLENSAEKFMNIKFYSYEYKRTGKVRYGIMAQEVKDDFPHSVGTFWEGGEEYYAFNPNNLIFTGMKVIQENSKEIIEQDQQIRTLEAENQDLTVQLAAQQREIEAIKAALAELGIDFPRATPKEVPSESVIPTIPIRIENDSPELQQNIPNPAHKSTTIPYYLSEGTQSATLLIRDMTGRTIAKHTLPAQKGVGKIEVNIEDTQLRGGTFTYSLYINENLIDTKKMVLLLK